MEKAVESLQPNVISYYVNIIDADYDGKVYVWDLGLADPPVLFNSAAIPWPMVQHDARHTGNYDADVTNPEVAPDTEPPVTIKTAISLPLTATDNVAVGRCRIFYKEGSTYNPGYIAENMTSTFPPPFREPK